MLRRPRRRLTRLTLGFGSHNAEWLSAANGRLAHTCALTPSGLVRWLVAGRFLRLEATVVISNRRLLLLLFLGMMTLYGCEGVLVTDTQSLLSPRFTRSEVLGLIAGFGTTFAALPDLIAMLRRRSSVGVNPKMAAIMGAFQILWIWYGLLIVSRPVVLWNTIAVVTNFFVVGAYRHYARRERKRSATTPSGSPERTHSRPPSS